MLRVVLVRTRGEGRKKVRIQYREEKLILRELDIGCFAAVVRVCW